MPKQSKGKKYCCVADMALSISSYFPELLLKKIWEKRQKNKGKKSRRT